MATENTALEKALPVKAASVTTQAVSNKALAKVAKPIAPAKTAKIAKATKTAKVAKLAPAAASKREKLVRDSFTVPKSEYEVLGALKLRANGLAVPAKKSELLRAGIKALAAMKDAAFLAALQGVPAIKTGRPAMEAPATKVRKAKNAAAPQAD